MEVLGIEANPGSHLCCMYRGSGERDALLQPFISEGLLAGDTCFLAVQDSDTSQLRARLDETLPTSPGRQGALGELILRTGSEPIFDTDSIDIEEVIRFWDDTVSAALAAGNVTFVRLSAEATWWMTQFRTLD
jgi:hypothetical protein